jgi:hypothetical protein
MADFGNVSRIRTRESDREIADSANDRTLMCCVQGCPLRWSVETDGRYCSGHAWTDPRLHDRVTQRALDALADLAVEAQRYRPPPKPMTREERRNVGNQLRAWVAGSRDKAPKVKRDWAHTLLARIQAGELVPTQAQRDAVKRVIPHAFADESESWGEAA